MGKGGGGGAPTQTTSTNYQTNIPEYAKPYVETMLGATQQQLFQGNPTGDGGFNITGFQPYKAYGGTYDAQGNQTSYDPSKSIAGFSPLQQQSFQGASNLGPAAQVGQGSALASAAGIGALNAQYGGEQFGNTYQGIPMYNPGRFNQQRVGTQQFTGDQVGQYMNPYLQQSLDPQLQEIQRQYGITGTQQQSAATQAGAFGGSREAIMAAENERNKNTAMNQAIGQGYNTAYGNAQNQFNAQQQANLQAQQANQQTNLGTQQAQQQANQFGYGQLANQAQNYAQYGQAANQLNAQQQQFGANFGLQGLQQANQAASTLGQLGQTQFGQEQGIIGLQNQMGAQQQAQQQQIINQSMQDYANAQQYPLMQLGTMSNMIRGLPMQAQTTQQYAAAPNSITQGIGAAGAAASLYNATKAEGGVIKSMASGGIASVPKYDVGGRIRAMLENKNPAELKDIAETSESEEMQKMAKDILSRAGTVSAAAGGIMRYAKGDEVDLSATGKGSLEDRINAASNAAANGVNSEGQNVTMAGGVNPETGTKAYEQPGLLGAKAPVLPNAATKATPDMLVGGIKGVPAPPAMTEDPFYKSLLAEQEAAKTKAGKSVSDFAEEVRAAKKAAGVDVDTARQNLRAEEMGRKANLADEARRQKDMRLAEFFASWGSTPGPTLVAGMSALKKSIPDMIGDRREAKKLERESDKIIYDIDEAIRVEKLGDVDKAAALKEKAAAQAAELNKTIATYKAHADSSAAHMYGSQLQYLGHRETAKATADASAARTKDANEERKFATVAHAQTNTTNLLRAHDLERKESQYVNNYNMTKIGKDENGVDIALDKLPKELRGQVAEARRAVNEVVTRQKDELREARDYEKELKERTSLGKGIGKNDTNKNSPDTETRPSWAPAEAKKAPDGNWYVPKGSGWAKVSPNS